MRDGDGDINVHMPYFGTSPRTATPEIKGRFEKQPLSFHLEIINEMMVMVMVMVMAMVMEMIPERTSFPMNQLEGSCLIS